MALLFDRSVALTVDTLRITGLRIQFRVTKTAAPEPNTAEIVVTNLSATTRAQMRSRGARVILEAGYGDRTEVLFTGDSRRVAQVRRGVDWESRIECGDGERAYAGAVVNESFGPGVKPADVMRRLASSLGVGVGNAVERLGKGDLSGAFTEFTQGVTLSGKSRTEMDRLTGALGLTWSIQNGELVVLKPGEATEDEAVVLSSATGLLGSPEVGEEGVVKARSLLIPGLRPKRRVLLVSDAVDGVYVVSKATFVGDTHGQSWGVECELVPL